MRLASVRMGQGIFYGWWVLAACMGMQILTTGLFMQAYGAYVTVMQGDFGWSKTQFSLGFSLQNILSGFFAPYLGWLIYRYGPRRMIRLGVLIFAISFMLFSMVNALWNFYLLLLLMSVGVSLSGFMAVNTVAVNWFEARRSVALSLIQTGMSIGGLFVPVVAYALSHQGWRFSALASGLVILILGQFCALIIRNQPEDMGLLPDGMLVERDSSQDSPKVELSLGQALRTKAFWFLSFGHGLALMIVFAVMVHLVIFLQEERGLSLQHAAGVASFLTAVTMMGQLLGGYLGDKVNKRLLVIVCMLAHTMALGLLALGQNMFSVYLFVILHGLAWGIRGPLMQSLRADYFGRRHFARIMGYSAFLVTMGVIVGPILAGVMADHFASYRLGFLVLAAIAIIGAVCFVFASRPKLSPA
ncbi:MAG: MFS transporter [Deinococcales bacterium]